ncbi:MAG: hypothetical protein QUV06_04790 [Cyanobium sp. CZS 48M]|nr:hypothetical protein [Cyanobium sp. CZS48M]
MSVPAAALQLSTLAGCGLTIAGYPRFRYDARGGGGSARLGPASSDGTWPLQFPPQELQIPPLDWRSTRLLGVPLPPGLSISIEPQRLEGVVDPASGGLALSFQARFVFGVGSLYRAPPLLVSTELVTGELRSRRHRCCGQPLGADGTALLVGVATIEPSGEAWLDRFLGLPDEALALLRCRFSSESGAGFPWEPPSGRSAPGQSAPA